MDYFSATSIAFSNIALIKYWGNADQAINLPSNGSISMNLEKLSTRIDIDFSADYKNDLLTINQKNAPEPMLTRTSQFLDRVRNLVETDLKAHIITTSNIPMGTGLASSAAAFAALSLAATSALGLTITESELSRLARLGSGSACRSVPGGFVEWNKGTCDKDSFAASIAPPNHWELCDCIAVISTDHKKIGSRSGHAVSDTSTLQSARVADANRRLTICRQAIMERNFSVLAEVAELDSNMMHAVMMTSNPPLIYMSPTSLQIIKMVPLWRLEGLPVFYTLDAGPNVHLICPTNICEALKPRLLSLGVESIIISGIGGPAKIINC